MLYGIITTYFKPPKQIQVFKSANVKFMRSLPNLAIKISRYIFIIKQNPKQKLTKIAAFRE